MKEIILLFYLIFGFCFVNSAFPQKVDKTAFLLEGHTTARYFGKEDFDANPQFWDACQAKDGVMYFANNDGVIVYNGEQWFIINLPNNSACRSLALSEDGQIYAGGYNELGTIQKDAFGVYYYSSLMDSLDLRKEGLENVWKIHSKQGEIYVRSFKELLVIDAKKRVKILPATQKFTDSFIVNNRLYVQDILEGIFLYNEETGTLEEKIDAKIYQDKAIKGFFAPENTPFYYFLSADGTLFQHDPKKVKTKVVRKLIDDSELASYVVLYKGRELIISTLSSKLISYDLLTTQHIERNRFNGLKKESIHALYLTEKQNLWLLLNNGLHFVEMDAPIQTIFDEASVYDLSFHNNGLYLATNKGLYYAKQKTQDGHHYFTTFKQIEGSNGQVWSLSEINGNLYMNHDLGLFLVDNEKLIRIPNVDGIWKTIAVPNHPKNYLICTYHGIYLAALNDLNILEVKHKISNFNESARDILATKEPHTFWLCHGYKGVYRIRLDERLEKVSTLEHFTEKEGLPSIYNINVHLWNDEFVFTTNQGIYRWNTEKYLFEPHPTLNEFLGTDKNIRQLIKQNDFNWFIKDDILGYFKTSEKSLHTALFSSFKGNFNRGMECLVPISDQQTLIGTRQGLYIANTTPPKKDSSFKTRFTNIKYDDNSTSIALETDNKEVAILPNHARHLTITFSSPKLSDKSQLFYSYKLNGMDNNWSDWTAKSEINYNFLEAGEYTFCVKSKSNTGEEAQTVAFKFRVSPKWYMTYWAISIFISLLLLCIIIGFTFLQHRFKNEKIKIQERAAQKQKLLELELAQLKLEQENQRISEVKEHLEQDVIYQSKELVNFTTLLAHKRGVLLTQKEELETLEKEVANPSNKKSIRSMIRALNINLAEEKHIQVFDAEFERIHSDFFQKLKEQFPELNQRELRLCAFIKMNLSNKEIAPLLSISTRGIESARYRLRKKLNLNTDDSLQEFLRTLE